MTGEWKGRKGTAIDVGRYTPRVVASNSSALVAPVVTLYVYDKSKQLMQLLTVWHGMMQNLGYKCAMLSLVLISPKLCEGRTLPHSCHSPSLFFCPVIPSHYLPWSSPPKSSYEFGGTPSFFPTTAGSGAKSHPTLLRNVNCKSLNPKS